MGMACASRGKHSIPEAMAEGFILSFSVAAGSVGTAIAP